MNKILIFYFFTLLLGIILALHLAMNSEVGKAIGNPRVGNAVFWCIGALTAIAIGMTGWRSGALASIAKVNPMLLTAGALGACLLVLQLSGSLCQVKTPAGLFYQLACRSVFGAMILSHFFGWVLRCSASRPCTSWEQW